MYVERVVKVFPGSLKDNHHPQLNYSLIEPFWVIHPDNCHSIGCRCTSRKKSAELEKMRELWWKQRKRTSLESTGVTTQWDPKFSEEWD